MPLEINLLLWTAHVGGGHLRHCEILMRLGYGHDFLRATDAAA